MTNSAVAGAGSAGTLFATIGDHKHGYQTADHAGWILENGRLLTTLTATQQTAATALGFGANLLNADGMMPIGAGTKALRSTGGAATATVLQTHLPNVNFVGGSHGHAVNDPGHAHSAPAVQIGTRGVASGSSYNMYSQSGNFNGFSSTDVSVASVPSATAGISLFASGNLSIPSGGAGTALPVQNPYIARNSFVYLGT